MKRKPAKAKVPRAVKVNPARAWGVHADGHIFCVRFDRDAAYEKRLIWGKDATVIPVLVTPLKPKRRGKK